ncbi:MAG: LamG-like jellyroll fold domain-containing protein [Limisphaerales bacterium]
MTALALTNTSPAMFFRLYGATKTNCMTAATYNEITNNLIAWYPLAGDINDHWGNDNATANLTPVWTNGVLGAADTALFLPGAQGLTANDNVLPLGDSPRTFSFWLYLTSLPTASGEVALLFQYGSANNSMNCYLQNVSGVMNAQIFINGNEAIFFPFNAPLNQWFQLTVGINSGQEVYLSENGVNLVDDSQTITVLNTQPGGSFFMGCWSADPIDYTYGAMADFRVYNASLTAAQLMTNFLAVYTSTTVLPQLLYLKMQDDVNTAPAYSYTNWPAPLADSSSRDNTNVLCDEPTTNDDTVWVSNPGNIKNSAMHFHGVSPSYIDTGDDADFAFTNQNYSVNFWAMPETASGTFMSCGIDNTNGWYINEDVNYDVHFNTCSNGSTSGLDGLNVQSGNGSWNDVCITVQGGTNVTMYWNGGLEYNGTVAAAAPSGTNALWLVQQNSGAGIENILDGNMWLPQIWDTTLSPNDVAKLYYEQMNGAPWP